MIDSATTFLTSAEAGRVLGVTGERVRQLVRSGRLEAIATPLGRLIPLEAVEALARERAAVPPHGSRTPQR
jgi:excisionase family DNA binding protein